MKGSASGIDQVRNSLCFDKIELSPQISSLCELTSLRLPSPSRQTGLENKTGSYSTSVASKLNDIFTGIACRLRIVSGDGPIDDLSTIWLAEVHQSRRSRRWGPLKRWRETEKYFSCRWARDADHSDSTSTWSG